MSRVFRLQSLWSASICKAWNIIIWSDHGLGFYLKCNPHAFCNKYLLLPKTFQILYFSKQCLRENSAWVSCVTAPLMKKALPAICFRMSLRWYLYAEELWQIEIVPPLVAKDRHVHYNKDNVFLWSKGQSCLVIVIKWFEFLKLRVPFL